MTNRKRFRPIYSSTPVTLDANYVRRAAEKAAKRQAAAARAEALANHEWTREEILEAYGSARPEFTSWDS